MNNTQLYFDVSGAIENNNFPLTGLYVDAQLTDTWSGNNLWYSISSISGNAGAISVQVNNEGHIVDGAFAGTTTTLPPTTQAPTTQAPTTQAPTTQAPTTQAPTTQAPTTQAPTTQAPTTQAPTTQAPTTQAPTTQAPTTQAPTTQAPTTQAPTTQAPTTQAPTTQQITISGEISTLEKSLANIGGTDYRPSAFGFTDFTIISNFSPTGNIWVNYPSAYPNPDSYSASSSDGLARLEKASSTSVNLEHVLNYQSPFEAPSQGLLAGTSVTFTVQYHN